MSSSSYISQQLAAGGPGSASSSRDGNNNNNNFMNGDNLLKLALKKPKSWKWELTTSSSTPNISFPKIQLFDSRTGELMVSVDKPDCVVKSEDGLLDRKNRDQRYRRSRSTCIREKITTSSEFLSDVFEQLQNKGMGHKLQTSVTQYRVEEVEEEEEERGYSLQKSRSASEIRRSVSLEQKKKIRKSPSCRSGSILGRISECYKSSTEEEPPRQSTPPPPAPTIPEISVVEEPPEPKSTAEEKKNKIYKLVRSNVGTLIVREESFHTQRSLRRRRQLEAEQSIAENEPQVDKRITITDIPDSSYNDTIKEIDNLISKVMLSHTLQDVQEPRAAQSRGRSSAQNGKSSPMRRRRSRRSASAGSNASSSGGGSRRGRNSPLVTVPPGSASSSSDEDLIALAESRFGSLKRRGRAKYKRNSTGTVNETTVGNGGGLVNGRKQQESNVRRSSISKITSSSSTTTTTVEIEECESFSLGSLRASLAAAAAAKRQRSSEKSSSTSLSTLSPPSPAAESLAEEKLNGSREPTIIRAREQSLEKVGDSVELGSTKTDGERVVRDVPHCEPSAVAEKLSNEIDRDERQNRDQEQSSKEVMMVSTNGEVNGIESVSEIQGIPVNALVAESNGKEELSNEFETCKGQDQLSSASCKDDQVDLGSKQVNGEVLMYSAVCKIGDVLEIPANTCADATNCIPLPAREFNEKEKLCNKNELVELQEALSVVTPDAVNWISNTLDEEKEVENVVNEISDECADIIQDRFTTDCVDIQSYEKLELAPNEPVRRVELPTRDRERSPMKTTVNSTVLSSQQLENEVAKTDATSVASVRKIPSKDCTAIQESEELKVTETDASPRVSPSFGSYQHPQNINGFNESAPSSLAWSYLPHLATSHSTSSLASLRARPTPDNSSDSTSPQPQSAVQRRQLKSYARRHHRSSFQLFP
ncbi:uncharacterized protein LOC135700872 [Ochlerotatus camptorhynchus]|uniref:uncharacterized protein LOC135700872 n=1 Tax=Ochlerotatus camptorhynchus TaxID=644619 RepID=UPI0031CF86EC